MISRDWRRAAAAACAGLLWCLVGRGGTVFADGGRTSDAPNGKRVDGKAQVFT